MSRLQQFRERRSRDSARTQQIGGWAIVVVLFVAVNVLTDHLHNTARMFVYVAGGTIALAGLTLAWRDWRRAR